MKLKKWVMYANLLLIGAVCFSLQYQSTHQFFQVPLLSEKEWIEKMEGKKETQLQYQLYLEGEKLPLYSSDIGEGYLISLSNERGVMLDKITASEGYEVAFLDIGELENFDTMLQEMKPLPFIIYNETSYCKGNAFFTSLPIMILDTYTTEYDGEGEELRYGEMTLFGGSAIASPCEFHIRGVSSRSYYKMSYKLNLLDENGVKNQESLLGMREDDDWILRSLASDESKIREKLATDLWNEMNAFGSYHMKYIELFLDGTYWGLYALQEPLDFKTLQCTSEDTMLYKTCTWPGEALFLNNMEMFGRNNLRCGDIEIDKAHKENLDLAYDVMEEYKYLLGGKSLEKIQLDLDKENLYRLNIFLSAIIGVDNTGKNQYIIANSIGSSKFKIRKLPWDFDMTFGLMVDDRVHEDAFSSFIEDETISYLMSVEPDETKAGLRETYNAFSTTVLNEEHLLEQVDRLYCAIYESGAQMRENIAWKQDVGEEQVEVIKQLIRRRLIWMDEYYNSF
ncbi:MAG: hypothetical protein HFI26_01270 [Lachnospiraceae bacterium]|jgi:hypothetical protein|nr:hypothetical protein [Lachnospiraceae bacterium]